MARRMKIVECEWEDPTVNGEGWTPHPEQSRTLRVRTAGYLVRKDRRYVAITLNWSENGDWADTQVIPRKNVLMLRVLGRSRAR